MTRTWTPAKESVKIYEHSQAGGIAGHGWDVFFGDGTHRAFEEEEPARDAAAKWSKAHKVSVWTTETKGADWRLLPNPSSPTKVGR